MKRSGVATRSASSGFADASAATASACNLSVGMPSARAMLFARPAGTSASSGSRESGAFAAA